MKTRLDVECKCNACGCYFIICNLDRHLNKAGNGYNLSGIKCVGCELSRWLEFDLVCRKATGIEKP